MPAQHRVIDELVYVGRADLLAVDDYHDLPAYVAVVIPDDLEPLSRREGIVRMAWLAVLFVSVVLAIGLGIGYAA